MDEYTPSDIPLYEDQAAREEGYRSAQREGRPYLAIERYEDGYAVTYDLLPADAELAAPTHKELGERIRHTVEEIVGDESRATVEVSQSVSASLGNVGVFQREHSAREVGAVIARLALDADNWVEPSQPAAPFGDEFRTN